MFKLITTCALALALFCSAELDTRAMCITTCDPYGISCMTRCY